MYREEGLAAGWESSTPAADTILRRMLLNWTSMLRVLVGSMGGRVLERDDVVAADLARPSAWLNLALLTQPTGDVAGLMAALDELYAASDATGMAGVFSAWPTTDLRPFGWTLGGHPPFMYRPVGTGAAAPAPPPGCAVERVVDADGLGAFADVLRRGYPLPELGEDPDEVFPPAVLELAPLRLFVVREDGRALAAAAAWVDDGLNDVTLVATLPEARGRGLGEAATWAATLAEPDLPAGLLASDLGRPVYERTGYLSVLRFTFWYRERGPV